MNTERTTDENAHRLPTESCPMATRGLALQRRIKVTLTDQAASKNTLSFLFGNSMPFIAWLKHFTTLSNQQDLNKPLHFFFPSRNARRVNSLAQQTINCCSHDKSTEKLNLGPCNPHSRGRSLPPPAICIHLELCEAVPHASDDARRSLRREMTRGVPNTHSFTQR